jgi:hypothetical protein
MGLDAVVYRNKTHLKLGPDEKVAQLVPQTGEVYFESDALSREYRHQLKAVANRLGNVTEISTLREEVARLIGPNAFIVQKILYSGTHSGDTIPVELLSSLSTELSLLRGTCEQSSELRGLISSLEELIRAAKDEANPIVFV